MFWNIRLFVIRILFLQTGFTFSRVPTIYIVLNLKVSVPVDFNIRYYILLFRIKIKTLPVNDTMLQ